ncbi:HNH endonuclease [Serratia fonticola]
MKAAITHEELVRLYLYVSETGCFFRIRKNGNVGMAVGYYGKKYATLNIKGKNYLLHRLAWFYIHGEWPESDIDHINGITKDNRLANLRCATRQQNSWNRKMAANNTSGFKGVSLCRRSGLYVAQIKQHGKVIVLGSFDTPEEASMEYEAVAMKHRGEYHMQTVSFVREDTEAANLPVASPNRLGDKTLRRQRRTPMAINHTADFIMFA